MLAGEYGPIVYAGEVAGLGAEFWALVYAGELVQVVDIEVTVWVGLVSLAVPALLAGGVEGGGEKVGLASAEGYDCYCDQSCPE